MKKISTANGEIYFFDTVSNDPYMDSNSNQVNGQALFNAFRSKSFNPRTGQRSQNQNVVVSVNNQKTSLDGFDMSGLGISNISTQLSNYSFITKLILSHNLLSQISESVFDDLPNLVYLDLSYNRLETLPSSITNLKSLEVLLLQNNDLKELPWNLGNLMKLKELNVEQNPNIIFPPREILASGKDIIISFLTQKPPVPTERKFINVADVPITGKNSFFQHNKKITFSTTFQIRQDLLHCNDLQRAGRQLHLIKSLLLLSKIDLILGIQEKSDLE